MTLLALSLGLTAMRLGLDGRYEIAMLCIVLAGMLDAVDGRLARLLRAESPLGAQLDSLTDFINFGVAPVFLVYLWALQATGRFGWAVILFFTICCALRLARFNVALEEPDRPAWKMRFFTGVPSPAAGGLVMLPMFLQAADLRMTENDVPLVLLNIIFGRAVNGQPYSDHFRQGLVADHQARYGAAHYAAGRSGSGFDFHLPMGGAQPCLSWLLFAAALWLAVLSAIGGAARLNAALLVPINPNRQYPMRFRCAVWA